MYSQYLIQLAIALSKYNHLTIKTFIMKKLHVFTLAFFVVCITNAYSQTFLKDGGNALGAPGTVGNNSNQDFGIETDGTIRLNVQADGDVGIGTLTPSAQLQVKTNASGEDGLRVQILGVTKLLVDDGGGVSVGSLTTPPANGLYVAGDVGIATSLPTSRLHVEGSTTSTSPVVDIDNNYTSSNSDVGGIDVTSTVAPGYGYGVYAEGGWRGVYGFGNGTTYTGSSTGVYGIATGTAGTRYGVYGYASGGTTNYGVYAAGNMAYTGSLFDVSDRKFKSNINYNETALDKIMMLKPATYTMKTEEFKRMNLADGLRHGFIAQELAEVFPELVAENVFPEERDENGKITDEEIRYQGVNYIAMIPILTKAIQEQQQIIEDLESRLAALESTSNNNSGKAASSFTSASLEQNAPNPFSSTTVIRYSIPSGASAFLQLNDARGSVIKTIPLDESGQCTIQAYELAAGNYTYSLLVNNSVVDSKQMTLLK